MLSTLRSKFPAFVVCLAIFAVVEIVVRILPMEKAAGGGIFLANHRRELLESAEPEFDYIIFGESRSMGLSGHAPAQGENFSVYNLSVPAMGSRYYRYFLRKYVKARVNPPAAVIFAGDPGIFQAYWNEPIHDPGRVYTDTREASLGDYLRNRFVRRLDRLAEGKGAFGVHHRPANAFWDDYSHRYLHLFSIPELATQYTGAERLFMLKESLPLAYETYKWREPIAHYTIDFQASYLNETEIPAHCNSCEAFERPECRPDLERLQGNRVISDRLRAGYGKLNLDERLRPGDRALAIMARGQAAQNQVQEMQGAELDLGPLEALLEEAQVLGTKIVLAHAPMPDVYRDINYYSRYYAELEALLARYPNAKMIRFSRTHLPLDRFVDHVHYTCAGAEEASADLYQNVMPQVIDFAPPLSGDVKRGFSDE